MSQRGKRGNHHQHHQRLDVEPQPPPSKRRKGRPPNSGGGGGGGGVGGNTCLASSVGAGSGIGGVLDGICSSSSGGVGNLGNSNNVATINLGSNASSISNSIVVDNDNNHVTLVPEDMLATTSAKIANNNLQQQHQQQQQQAQGTVSSAAAWQARSVADIKISSIYNRSSTEAPAELYRKDLISAMKLPDSEPLANYEYLVVNDQWKQEWEKGVQVPVNPDSLPEPCVDVLTDPIVRPAHDFKLPKNRFLRITKDESYSPELHCLTNVVTLAENTCAYDIDQVDEAWLKLLNTDRAFCGAFPITEAQFERVIEELEIRCWEQIQVILKNEEGLGIEYDENVICDVCRSPDSEEANEMVFCDNCNICVHQACYGITAIPSGQWLCRTCSMGIKPECVLCPNKGGAMKSTKSGKHWAHVSCALWIPEVSIGCVDRMEPITKISSIPQSRWALICVLCRERVGACIQCSVKTCKTAYHVTCAFQHGLEMRAIIEEGNAEDGVKLRSYCHKHSVSKGKKEGKSAHGSSKAKNKYGKAAHGSGGEEDECRRRKSRKSDMTSEERNQARAQRLQEVEAQFDKHVNIRDISCHLFDVDEDAIEAIYNYWKLKRKSRHNRALIPPKSEDVEMIARKQEQQDLENHKLVVHLRQDLERVRNLCYMVSRREKLSRSLFKLREQVFYKQITVLSDENLRDVVGGGSGVAGSGAGTNVDLGGETFKNAVIYANDGPTLYDKFYSSSSSGAIPEQYQNMSYILEKLMGSAKVGTGKSSTKGSAAARTTTSPAKRKPTAAVTNMSTATTTSATTMPATTATASGSNKILPNKKVNNGAIVVTPTTSVALTAVTSATSADKQKSTMSTTSSSRRNSVGSGVGTTVEKSARTTVVATAATTPIEGTTVPTTTTTSTASATARIRGSSRTSTTRRLNSESSQSSNSSGSSSSGDDDSSSDDGSSSGSGSSGSGSESDASSGTAGSTSSDSEAQSAQKSSPSKTASANRKKSQSYSRSVEMRQKQRRKSTTSTAAATAGIIGTIHKPTTATASMAATTTTTLLSSSSDEEANEENVSQNNNKSAVPANKQQSKSKQTTTTTATAMGTAVGTGTSRSPTRSTTATAATNRGRGFLSLMEKEFQKDNGSASLSSDESEELLPPKTTSTLAQNSAARHSRNASGGGSSVNLLPLTAAGRKSVVQQIYSDSESLSGVEDKEERATESNVSDSQNQQTIRTKAAMKEFTLQQQSSKAKKDTLTPKQQQQQQQQSSNKSDKKLFDATVSSKMSSDLQQHNRIKKSSSASIPLQSSVSSATGTVSKQNEKQHKFPADLLVVPQRQAAKKASENMRSTNTAAGSLAPLTNAVPSVTSTTQRDSERSRDRSDKDVSDKLKPKESGTSSKHEDKLAANATIEKTRSREKSSSTTVGKAVEQAEKNTSKRGRPPKTTKENENILASNLPTSLTKESIETSIVSYSQPSTTGRRRDEKNEKSVSVSSSFNKSNEQSAKMPTNTILPHIASTESNSKNTPTLSNELSKSNILVAYVPQRQAAKKAAQQLKNSGKLPAAADVAGTAGTVEEKERVSVNEKDSKLKTPESRAKPTPTRRMSVRDTTAAIAAKDTTSTQQQKTPTSSRRRSKDTLSDAAQLQQLQQTTPKKATDKRNISTTSSSESDSSSSSSSGSSSSSSETDSEEESEAEDERTTRSVAAAVVANKRSPRKSTDKPIAAVISRQNSVSATATTKSPKSSPQKQLRRNVSNTSSTSSGGVGNVEDLHETDKSLKPTRRKSSSVEEKAKQKSTTKSTPPGISIVLDDDVEAESSFKTVRTRAMRRSKSRPPSPPTPTLSQTGTDKKLDDKKLAQLKTLVSAKTIEIMDDDADADVDTSNKETDTGAPNLEQEIAQRKASNLSSNTKQNQNKNQGSLDKLLNRKEQQISRSNSSSVASVAIVEKQEESEKSNKATPTLIIDTKQDECGELPMDIDEELTTAPTHTTLPSSKLSDLADDLDDRPPAAPVPASPSPLPSNEEDLSDGSEDNLSDNERVRGRNRNRRRTRSRRHMRPGSPPMSPEEEHTHHTQHLLNEMELVRALAEEAKNELAANASKYSASSSSPAVAVIAPEPPEIIELDSNSNSAGSERLKQQGVQEKLNSAQISETATPASPESSSPFSSNDSHHKKHKADSAATKLPLSESHNVCSSNIDAVKSSSTALEMESGHQPIVDTILDMVEENEKQKQQQQQQGKQQQHHHHNAFSESILNTTAATFTGTQVLDPRDSFGLSNSGDVPSSAKQICEEEEEATRNLLEKLRKTKRSRNDDLKEQDFMPPPTPAIPSVYPFHNAADPEDIIHVQKENAEASACSFGNDLKNKITAAAKESETLKESSVAAVSLIVPASTYASTPQNSLATTPNTTPTKNISAMPSNNNSLSGASANNLPFSENAVNFLDKTVPVANLQQQMPISPMEQVAQQQLSAVTSFAQQISQPPNVDEISSFLQKELAEKTQPNKQASVVDSFNKLANVGGSTAASSTAATPDFVDLHAAATAKDSIDFTSTGSVGSNKLVVDCDYDENTRMQSPYAMPVTRIWNENDLIAARRSSSPSSVSESNDQPPTIECQQPQQQQPQQSTQQQQAIGSQIPPHMPAQNNLVGNNVINTQNAMSQSATDVQNCKSFFNPMETFGIQSSFSHSLQQQQQRQQHSPLVNGIDAMMSYSQGYNQATTPTQGTQQQQQAPAASNQYNGSVSLFHNTPTPMSNQMNQIPFAPNAQTSGSGVMYPSGPGLGGNVPMTAAASSTVQQQSTDTNSQAMYGMGPPAPNDPNSVVPNAVVGGTAAQPQYAGAAFTSSSHNLALTAAIIGTTGSSSLLEHHTPHQLQQAANRYNLTSPGDANTTYNAHMMSSCAEAMMPTQPTLPSNQQHTSPTKNSPSKRSSGRYNQQQQQQQQQLRNSHKSPQIHHKSPGKSPRQMELLSKQMQQQQQQQQQQQHALTEFTNIPQKQPKYDPLTHTLAGKPRQRAPRGSGSGSRGGRGRGRGRGRGSNNANTILPLPPPLAEYGSNTHIVNNLVGTPYEFNYDEDLASPGVENLQSLRDRRRSFDSRSQQGSLSHHHPTSNSTDPQKYTSPTYAHGCKVRGTGPTNTAAAGTPTSLTNCNSGSGTRVSSASGNDHHQQSILHSIVQPVLPGPVDMRTYNLGFEAQHSSASQEAYNNNLLGEFDSGAANQTLSEFDEEDEKEFQSALRATGTTISSKQLPASSSVGNVAASSGLPSSNASLTTDASTALNAAGVNSSTLSNSCTTHQNVISDLVMPPDLQTSMETTSEEVSIDSDTTLTTKASLSDSRNQLKLKIKGPLAYPDSYNYNTSNASSLSLNLSSHTSSVVQANAGIVQASVSAQMSATVVNSSAGGGLTNSRRMRKKELLSLYVVQKDTNMDDSSCGLPATDAGMTNALDNMRKTDALSGGLDDYSADLATGSSKRFKKNSSRELRSMDASADINDIAGMQTGADGRRRSACSSGSNDNGKTGAASSAGKRRGRSKTLEGSEDEPTPKLKIKIRNLGDGSASATTIGPSASIDNSSSYEMTRRMVSCPPKKRLTSSYTKPTYEDLKRESMHFRKMVMQDFGEDDEERTRRSSTTMGALLLDASAVAPVPSKKSKSSKPKKDKKEKKRNKERSQAMSIMGAGSMMTSDNMTTTLIERLANASPGDPPKLILRINKRKPETQTPERNISAAATPTVSSEEQPVAVTAPIRLKLARVSDGGGYVIGHKKKKEKRTSTPITATTGGNVTLNSVATPTDTAYVAECRAPANIGLSKLSSDAFNIDRMHEVNVNTNIDIVSPANTSQEDELARLEAAKDSSTPSPRLIIDSSKSLDVHDSSNTASSLLEGTTSAFGAATSAAIVAVGGAGHVDVDDAASTDMAAAITVHQPTSTSITTTTTATTNCNENSSSNSSSHSSSTTTTTTNSNTNNSNSRNNNNHNNNNNSNNNNNNNNNSSNSGLLPLNKDCEVR